VPCIFTRATLKHKEIMARETSLLNLFKKHGFHTTWISMNDFYRKGNLPISAIAESADEKIFRFGLDEFAKDSYLLPYFHNTINKHKAGRQLIVLHLKGSHFNYRKRYTTDFAVFKPDRCESTTCNTNAYDNSILFTDYMLWRFIQALKNQEALLFYVSDHGESLGETDERGQVYWQHGQLERIEQRMVPMHVWASSRFIAKYPDRFAALERRANTALSHDHFFRSVVDCAGINSDAVDSRLSLCTQGTFTERPESFQSVAQDEVGDSFAQNNW
jgi:glucan phosphoethanolaminetransferase (alkaline phosphatase superfamily)